MASVRFSDVQARPTEFLDMTSLRSRTRDLRILFRGFSRSVCVVSISRSSGLKSDF
jgi:hypothetical protein